MQTKCLKYIHNNKRKNKDVYIKTPRAYITHVCLHEDIKYCYCTCPIVLQIIIIYLQINVPTHKYIGLTGNPFKCLQLVCTPTLDCFDLENCNNKIN